MTKIIQNKMYYTLKVWYPISESNQLLLKTCELQGSINCFKEDTHLDHLAFLLSEIHQQLICFFSRLTRILNFIFSFTTNVYNLDLDKFFHLYSFFFKRFGFRVIKLQINEWFKCFQRKISFWIHNIYQLICMTLNFWIGKLSLHSKAIERRKERILSIFLDKF